jgi:hypothetical protein
MARNKKAGKPWKNASKQQKKLQKRAQKSRKRTINNWRKQHQTGK